jgi:hypothetical protein
MVLVVMVGDGDGPATHVVEDSAGPVDSSQTAENHHPATVKVSAKGLSHEN